MTLGRSPTLSEPLSPVFTGRVLSEPPEHRGNKQILVWQIWVWVGPKNQHF